MNAYDVTHIPDGYTSVLDLQETERAIKFVKDTFERELASALTLMRVSAPLFVKAESGLNDNLSGVERPVGFDVKETGENLEIVQSLAKWKRQALARYQIPVHCGLYTDMNAIRRDEDTDEIHSLYVDQWDWEKVITANDRNQAYLKESVNAIYGAIVKTFTAVEEKYPALPCFLPKEITFVTAQELEDAYPELTPEGRETAHAKKHGAIFVMQIGGNLASGKPHGNRAPDYDDWSLNGDIIVYYPLLGRAVELSSMGIRVDADALKKQCELSGKTHMLALPFQKALLNNEYPLTMGGGVGQSRLCLLMLNKAHIGEVQSSVWPGEMVTLCAEKGVILL